MAVTYLTPGVFVEEVDRGSKPIETVSASMAAFVGVTAEASVKKLDQNTGEWVEADSLLNKPTLVTNWTQFLTMYGGFVDGAYMPDAVYGYFNNGGGACYIVSIRALNKLDDKGVAASVSVPNATGKGKESFTVTAKIAGESGNAYTVVVTSEKDDKFTLAINGEKQSGLSMKKGDEGYIGNAKFSAVTLSNFGTAAPAAGNHQLDGGGVTPLTAAEFIGDSLERTGLSGLEALDDIRLILAPDLMHGYDGSEEFISKIKAVQAAMIADCERLRYRFAVLDTPPGLNAQQAKEWRETVSYDTSYAAMYYPWIEVADLSDNPRTTKFVPPSGPVVGIYNRVDATIGFHKAPANEVIQGALGLEVNLTKGEQGVLNPIGVNCIRSFSGRGIRVWGARTLSSNGSWRYINVRRLFIVVGASLDIGLQWVVFEPNDYMLWSKVRRDINAFLSTIWLGGALFGATKDEAFYVKCDAELNPPEIRDLGQLVIEVGMSPVKPAEFVILRLSQWAGPNAEA